jgi:hypothetical protein
MNDTARVDLDAVPVGNNKPEPQELTPDQTVSFKTFAGGSLEELDEQINRWVSSTKNIIAVPGSLSQTAAGYSISLTYILSSRSYKDV